MSRSIGSLLQGKIDGGVEVGIPGIFSGPSFREYGLFTFKTNTGIL
jgi:hypothetical protein